MNSANKIFLCVVILYVFLLPKGFSQLIDNQRAKIILDDFFFQTTEIKKRKIKTISVSYSTKKSLKPIQKNVFKSTHFLVDKNGFLTRKYTTNQFFQQKIDTSVEWRYYKNKRLTTIKKTGVGGIKVKSIFYENNLPATYIYGVSQNSSPSKINLFVSSYKEERAEYIKYYPLNKKDTLIKYKSVSSTVFKKKLIEWTDSTSCKITYTYPLAPEKNVVYTYNFNDKQCEALLIEEVNKPIYKYVFQYSSTRKMLSYTTFNETQNTSIYYTELIYNEKNGLLRAIITKDLYDNTIFIKKYTYTYYE